MEAADFALLLIMACRLFEAANSLLLRRWLKNIRVDIMKFIRLVKQRQVYVHTDEVSGQVTIRAKEGEVLGDSEDCKDFAIFLKAVV